MRTILIGAVFLFLALTGLFGTTFYLRHVANRDCFNAEGRCFDPQTGTVILEQSGSVWLALSLLCLIVFSLLIWALKRLR